MAEHDDTKPGDPDGVHYASDIELTPVFIDEDATIKPFPRTAEPGDSDQQNLIDDDLAMSKSIDEFWQLRLVAYTLPPKVLLLSSSFSQCFVSPL